MIFVLRIAAVVLLPIGLVGFVRTPTTQPPSLALALTSVAISLLIVAEVLDGWREFKTRPRRPIYRNKVHKHPKEPT